MDDLRFILESPQQKSEYKKRPRLVTSCDSCRLRKIKCLQSAPETTCEACKEAKMKCSFRDRERYFEERSRVITGANSPQPQRSSNHASDAMAGTPHDRFHSSESSSAYDAFSVNSHSHLIANDGREYSYYPSESQHGQGTHRRNGSLPNGSYYQTNGSHHSVPRQFSAHTSSPHARTPISLFDPSQPQQPNPILMPQLIQIFYQENRGRFPYMVYEETLQHFFNRTLSSLLANCIAAAAARNSNVLELTAIDPQTASETFENQAKVIMSSNYLVSDVDTFHALTILAWIDRKHQKTTSAQTYSQMAMTMAAELGLSADNSALRLTNDREHYKLPSAWPSYQAMVSTGR